MGSSSIGATLFAGSQSNSTSGGLGAGINISALVAAAMASQTQQLTLMQQQQQTIASQQSALNSFNTDLQALQVAAQALGDPLGQLTNVAATSSNTSVLTASAANGTASGTHSIVVTNLATTSSAYSAELASSSTPIATGTLTIKVGSNTAVPITVDNTNNTLAGLAQSINKANIGVTASVVNDANGARLAIVSGTSGAPGDLTITPSVGLPAFTKGVTGVNANVTVDGIPIAGTTNTITSAIAGVNLNLVSAAPGTPVTLSLGPDTAQASSAINSFASSYNKVIADLNSQFTIDSTTNQPGVLAADSTIVLAQSQILSSASFSSTGNGTINSLADLGISFNNDGTLSVSNSALTAALQSNYASVQSFFQSTNTGSFGANLANTLQALADPITGSIAQDLTGLAQTQTGLGQQISDFQSQLNQTQQALTQQFTQVDVVLQELPLLLNQVSTQLSSLK